MPTVKTRAATMHKIPNNKAWWLVLPMFLLVAFSAIIPLMTVVNYSLQDIFDQNTAYFVGVEWYQEVLRDTRLHDSLLRQFGFSFSVLLIEIPLGIAVALMMPTRGWQASAVLILLALPLLIPWNVVGTIWQVFARGDIGLFGWTLNNLGIDYNYTSNALDAWLTVLLMDVWHWTSLVALLCYSGLRAIPDAYYQAAKIDRASRWAVFRYIQLPRLRNVLVIGVLLRFMDSFMIYTEPFVLTGGGPGTSTTFLSQTLTQMAIGQFDIGPAAAFSLVYFLIVLLVSWLFFTTITHMDKSEGGSKHDK
jgi:glycerol transport system permease protein